MVLIILFSKFCLLVVIDTCARSYAYVYIYIQLFDFFYPSFLP